MYLIIIKGWTFSLQDLKIEELSDKTDLQYLERQKKNPTQSKLMAKW